MLRKFAGQINNSGAEAEEFMSLPVAFLVRATRQWAGFGARNSVPPNPADTRKCP